VQTLERVRDRAQLAALDLTDGGRSFEGALDLGERRGHAAETQESRPGRERVHAAPQIVPLPRRPRILIERGQADAKPLNAATQAGNEIGARAGNACRARRLVRVVLARRLRHPLDD
jgi:hypothetical protein